MLGVGEPGKAGRSASPSAVSWSLGRPDVGLEYDLVEVGMGFSNDSDSS